MMIVQFHRYDKEYAVSNLLLVQIFDHNGCNYRVFHQYVTSHEFSNGDFFETVFDRNCTQKVMDYYKYCTQMDSH